MLKINNIPKTKQLINLYLSTTNIVPCNRVVCICTEYLDYSNTKDIHIYKKCVSDMNYVNQYKKLQFNYSNTVKQ